MHYSVYEKGSPYRPDANIVKQILDVAELQDQLPEETRSEIHIAPYDISATVDENVVGMAAYVESNKIALAYCEDPKFIWVNLNVIRSIEDRFLKDKGDWGYLLEMLWMYGYLIAKVKFVGHYADVKVYKQ